MQQRLVELRQAGQIGDILLLLEHTAVITLGRNAKTAHVLLPPEQLALRGVQVFECDRGGDVTFHGPAQLVGYPIFDLRGIERSQVTGDGSEENSSRRSALRSQEKPLRKTVGAVDYVRRLEEVLIRTCADFGIPTKRVPGLTGVWTLSSKADDSREGHDPGPQRALFSHAGGENLSGAETKPTIDGALAPEGRVEAKIAAIGVHISRGVTSHGFALNVNTDLSYFDLIVPCGIVSKPVTSMEKEVGHEIDFNAVAEAVSRNFGTVFSRQILGVDTIDALLGQAVGTPMKAPSEFRELRGDDEVFRA